MSIRGTVTLECDSNGCHADEVIAVDSDHADSPRTNVLIEILASDWAIDDDGLLHCPQCCEEGHERDEDPGSTYADPRDERMDRRHE